MEDLHFANMVQYEEQYKREQAAATAHDRSAINDRLTDLAVGERQRQASVPNGRMAQTIEHECSREHSQSI